MRLSVPSTRSPLKGVHRSRPSRLFVARQPYGPEYAKGIAAGGDQDRAPIAVGQVKQAAGNDRQDDGGGAPGKVEATGYAAVQGTSPVDGDGGRRGAGDHPVAQADEGQREDRR